jgi:polysaccharide transporter, PST family
VFVSSAEDSEKWRNTVMEFIDGLRSRPSLHRIMGNAGWLFADRVLRLGVGVIVSIWVARYLGPSRLGTLSYAAAFVALFASIASLGLDSIVIRDLVRRPADRDLLLGTAFWLKALGGVAMLGCASAAIAVIRNGDALTRLLVLLISTGTILQSLDVIDFWFQSETRSRNTVLAKNGAFVVVTVGKVILIQLNATLLLFAVAAVAEIALGAVGLIAAYRATGHRLGAWRADIATAEQLLRESWPLALSGMVIAVYMKIDQVMLGQVHGDDAVGVYSAAVSLSTVWYFIPTAIVASVYPALTRVREDNRQLYLLRLQQLYLALIWCSIIFAVPITLLSGYIVNFLYGNRYAEAGPILTIHIWTAVFVFFGLGKSIYIQCESLQLFSFICTVVGALLNVVCNLMLIPRYGGLGAAFATLCAQVTAALIIPALYSRDRVNTKMFFLSFVRFGVLKRL